MKSFIDVYNSISRNELEKLEKLRKKDILFGKLDLLLLILFMVATFFNFGLSNHIVICEIIIIFITYKISRLYKYTSFKEDYKKHIIEPIVNSYGENFIYDMNKEITKAEYLESGNSLGDEFYSSDYFETKDKTIKGSEITIYNNSEDKDGNKRTTTVFSGIYSIITLDNFAENTITMRSDSKLRNLFNNTNKNKVEVDSAKFEENFDLFCENRVYAMEVFTSEILNSIIILAEKMKQNMK